MHTIIDKEEFERRILNNDNFPFEEDDTFVVEGMGMDKWDDEEERYQPLELYRFSNGSLTMEKDFIEDSREPTEEEYARGRELSDDEVIKLNIALRTDDEDDHSYAEYSVWTREFKRRFEYFYSIEGFINRADEENEYTYAVPQIMCDQTKPIEEHIVELETLLPYFDYQDLGDEIGEAITIDIFEDTLSEYGTYHAYIRKDGSCVVVKTTYGHPSVEAEPNSYHELVEYIYKNLPYNRKRTEDDDCAGDWDE